MAEPLPAGSPGRLPGSYWVLPGRLLAGPYPGSSDPATAAARLALLRADGVVHLLDLTQPGELPPYTAHLPPPFTPEAVAHSRRPIPDHGIPSVLQMAEILDELDELLAADQCVYVHCRAGIGRTGTVVGCLLARHGHTGEEALERLAVLWHQSGRDRDFPRVPETHEQCEFIAAWPGSDPRDTFPKSVSETVSIALVDRLRDRYRGLLRGLAIGDALGMPVQYRRPGTFTPVGDLLGGGPYDLPRGAWTDDTAVALCLAESLVETREPDAADMQARLLRWQREGYLSSTDQCVGISAATARAIASAQWSGNPHAGSHDPAKAEREPLVRAGIAAAFHHPDAQAALSLAQDLARLTHQAPLALEACRAYAGLVCGALQGCAAHELLAPDFAPADGGWGRPLRPEVRALLAGGWREVPAHRLAGAGPAATQALDGLAVALGALDRGRRSFRDGVLWAVNLGGDADTNGALAGQLLGAVHGAAVLPPAWRNSVLRHALLDGLADRLLRSTLARLAEAVG